MLLLLLLVVDGEAVRSKTEAAKSSRRTTNSWFGSFSWHVRRAAAGLPIVGSAVLVGMLMLPLLLLLLVSIIVTSTSDYRLTRIWHMIIRPLR